MLVKLWCIWGMAYLVGIPSGGALAAWAAQRWGAASLLWTLPLCAALGVLIGFAAAWVDGRVRQDGGRPR